MPTQQHRPRKRSGSRSRSRSTRSVSGHIVVPSSVSSMTQRMGEGMQSLAVDLARTTRDLRTLASYGREQYRQLDPETKRRALAAVGVLAGLLAAGATMGALRGRSAATSRAH